MTTFRVTGSDGRKIAAYKFGDPSEIRATQLSGPFCQQVGVMVLSEPFWAHEHGADDCASGKWIRNHGVVKIVKIG